MKIQIDINERLYNWVRRNRLPRETTAKTIKRMLDRCCPPRQCHVCQSHGALRCCVCGNDLTRPE